MLGESIKKYRKERGLSQKALAEKCDISTSYIQQIELGQKKNPSLEVQLKLSKALDVPMSYLFGRRNKFQLLIDDTVTYKKTTIEKISSKTNININRLTELYNGASYTKEELSIVRNEFWGSYIDYIENCPRLVVINRSIKKAEEVIDIHNENERLLSKIGDIFKHYGYKINRHNIGLKDMIEFLDNKDTIIFDVPFDEFYNYSVKEMITFIDRSVNSEIDRLIKHFK